MLLPRSITTAPCSLVQCSGCGICRPLWHSVQKLFCWWHSVHWTAETCSGILTLGAFAGTPPTWQMSQSLGSFLPS